ncbi:PadR family transcriptional regulator [Senegalia massiliensis]|uniref:PadR family transcriptional regulator n=1 Tax=Senegalia massiliensis TaxID=1720316 RepID=A0A845QW47_9CLOT|nr:PadR family transcriptional regulator [Senegalia massiliensis]NBI06214.1 PadR family transcriptional regulator [Senegalia massiliensis]
MMDRSQLMRGTLEGCIVSIISKGETYGYEIVSHLQGYGFYNVKEGTIYPILVRLEKKKIISSLYKKSPLGPKRKYYFLTQIGEEFLKEFIISWNEVKKSVDSVLKGEGEYDR